MNVHGLRGRALRGAVLSMMLVVPPLAQRGPSSPNAGTSQAFVDPKGETTVVSTENQSGSRSPSISADGLFAAWVETYPRGGGPVRLTSARNAASGATAPAAINDGLGELSRLREANLDTGTTAIVMPPNALGVVGDPMLAANVVVASVDLNHPRPPPDVIETCTGNCGPPRLAPPPVVLPTVFRHVNGSTGWQQFGVGTQPAISGNAERVAFVEPSHVRKSYQEGFYAVIQPPSLPLLPPPDPFPVAVPNCSVQWPFATSCHYVKRAIQKDFVSGHVVVASSDGTRVADLLATVTTYRATNTNDPI